MAWKKVECPFEKDRKILQYLLTAPVFTEDGEDINEWMNRGWTKDVYLFGNERTEISVLISLAYHEDWK